MICDQGEKGVSAPVTNHQSQITNPSSKPQSSVERGADIAAVRRGERKASFGGEDDRGIDGELVQAQAESGRVGPVRIRRRAVAKRARAQREQGQLQLRAKGELASDWVLVTRNRNFLDSVETTVLMEPISVPPNLREWSDDFNNLFQILRPVKFRQSSAR